MNSTSTDLTVPDILKNDVECFRIIEYTGMEGSAIHVSPNGIPGIVVQHDHGRSALENIITRSGIASSLPTAFVYRAGIEPSIMNYKPGSYMTTQVILKPHALQSLLGINASALTDGWAELNEFSAHDLNGQLIEANDIQAQITLITRFLIAQREQVKTRDQIVEESLRLIQTDIVSITVKSLLERLNISERQFERRFNQTVGISPQSYIRVKRFNEAIRRIKRGQYEKLTDIAHALSFYDQSHLIRDIKAFSGMTPKDLSRNEDDFYHDQAGYSYL